MTDNRDVPDRIWITKEIRPYKVKKPKLLPEVENFEYAHVPKLVKKINDEVVSCKEYRGSWKALEQVLKILKGDG